MHRETPLWRPQRREVEIWHGHDMNRKRHELSHLVEPGRVLADMDAITPFRLDTTVIGVVHLETQEVEGARVIHRGTRSPDHLFDNGSEMVRKAAEAMGPERTFDPVAR
jgi:hypothetical protein